MTSSRSVSDKYSLGVKNMSNPIKDGVPMIIVKLGKDGEPDQIKEFNMENVYLSPHAAESIARAILPDIIAFYEDPANIAEFERWQAEQRAKGIPPPEPRRKDRRRR